MAETTYQTPTLASSVVTPTAETVYSDANIKQATTSPVAKPDLSDPYGLYEYYMNSPEIQAATKSVQDIQNQMYASSQALRTTTRALEGQNEAAMGSTGASINLIGKQVGRARQLTADELSALSENKMAAVSYLDTLTNKATNLYSIAQNERAQLQELIAQTGGEAGISYSDSYETALKKATEYTEKKAEKDAIKQLYLSTFGSSGKGMSTKEMEKKLKKEAKSTKEYEKQVKELALQTSKIQLQKLQSDLAKVNSENSYDPSVYYNNNSSNNSSSNSGTNIDQSPYSSIYG